MLMIKHGFIRLSMTVPYIIECRKTSGNVPVCPCRAPLWSRGSSSLDGPKTVLLSDELYSRSPAKALVSVPMTF